MSIAPLSASMNSQCLVRFYSNALFRRPPIVTIMGHVDHGKTSMLDFLRKSRIASGEAGGITQHIGAFQVALQNQKQLITFIDTPGHAAFSAIRQRGAQVTDLIVLVIAIEDGIMPQTEEVLKLSKSSSIPVIVAMNKWDKLLSSTGSISAAENSPQVRKLKDGLARQGVELEEYGGSVQCLPISALTVLFA
jgi:translation initiation factor IF-2